MPTSNPQQPPTAGVVDADPTPPRTAAADKLWAALRAHPGSTSVGLAATAGIGRSTAAKLLTRWHVDNLATRTATPSTGQPGKSPERWYIVESATAGTDPDAPAPEEQQPHSGLGDIAAPVNNHAAETAEPTEVTAEDTSAPDATPNDDHTTAASTLSDAPDDPSTDGVDPAAAESDPDDADATDAPEVGHSRAPAGASRTGRLPAGGLRGLVEDYLREHPEAAFGPSQIGKDLSRSGGAVANALVKLVDAGCAVVAQDKPRRYRLAPDEAGAATDTNA